MESAALPAPGASCVSVTSTFLNLYDFRPHLVDGEDRLFFGIQTAMMGLGALFAFAVLRTVVPEPPREETEAKILSLMSPEMYFSIQREEPVPVTEAVAPPRPAASPVVRVGRPTEVSAAPVEAPRSVLLDVLLATRGEGRGDAGLDIFAEDDGALLRLQDELSEVGHQDVASATPAYRDGRPGDDPRGVLLNGLGAARVGEAETREVAVSAPRAQAQAGPVEGAGDSESAAIRAALGQYSRQVKSCYDSALTRSPTLEGRIALGLDVVDGRVTSARLDDDSVGDAELEACVLRRARSWRFADSVSVSGLYLPFSLSTGGGR